MKYGRIARWIRRYVPLCEEKGFSLDNEESLDAMNAEIRKLAAEANDSIYLCLSYHFPLQKRTLGVLQAKEKSRRSKIDLRAICSQAYSADLDSFSVDYLVTAQPCLDFIVFDRTASLTFREGKALLIRNDRIRGERLGDRFNNLYKKLESQDRFSE